MEAWKQSHRKGFVGRMEDGGVKDRCQDERL